jgi:raffinose/stachyose/melibiose transport system substrate-binding protein
MKVARYIVMILVVSSLLLSACGGAPATPAPEPTAKPAAEEPAAEEPVVEEPAAEAGPALSGKLVYWALWNEGEQEQVVFSQIVEDFEKAYPDVDVEVTWAGREVLTKARSALMAGTQLDLVDQAADELNAALMKNDLALPLDDMLTEKAYGEDVAFQDVLLPGVLDPYKANGKVVFVPYALYTSAFWYDENYFADNGLTVPATWDELMAMCETLKGQGKACIAQDGTVDFYNAYYFYWLAERVMGPGAFYAAVSDTTGQAWADPGWLKVAQMVQEPVEKGYFMDGWDGNVWPAGQVAWAQGEAAIILCGSWVPNETSKMALEGFKYRGFPFPEVADGKGEITEVESYLIGWVIPKDAQNPAAAREFIKFAMQKMYRDKHVELAKTFSTRVGAMAPPELPDMGGWFETNTQLFKPYDGVQADFPSWWTTIFLPEQDKLIKLQITPEEFIAKMQAETAEYWSKPTPTPEAVR